MTTRYSFLSTLRARVLALFFLAIGMSVAVSEVRAQLKPDVKRGPEWLYRQEFYNWRAQKPIFETEASKEKLAKLINDIRAANRESGLVEFDLLLAEIFNSEKRHDELVKYLDSVVERWKTDGKKVDPRLYYERGHAHFQLKHAEKAIEDMAKAIELLPNDSDDKASYLASQGNFMEEAGQLDGARKALDLALELNPEQAPALLYRGKVLLQLREDDKAKADFDKLKEVSPDYYQRNVKRAVQQAMAKRVVGEKARPYDFKLGAASWILGNLQNSAALSIPGENPQLRDKASQSASKLADQLGVELGELPDSTGDKRKDLNAALVYLSSQRRSIPAQLLKKYGDKVAYTYRVSSGILLLGEVYRLRSRKLTEDLAKALLSDGPRSGLPEEIWKPVGELAQRNPENEEFKNAVRSGAMAAENWLKSQGRESASE